MDRLSALILVLAACGNSSDPAGDPPARTNGSKVAAHQVASTDAFCDQHAKEAAAPTFAWPELAGTAPPATKDWRWVNVWATWCKPCIEEMPRLQKWRDKLAAAGTQVDLAFVSIDETDEDVTAFRKLHPDAPPSTRIAAKDKGTAWLKSLGLDSAAIPIHVFVSPSGHVRCARAGGVREQDYAVVGQLFAE
jgi:thiol-disulfide isomerase/thioredoxin